MQNVNTTSTEAAAAVIAAQPVPTIETVQAITTTETANLDKLKAVLRGKRVAKPVTVEAKPAKPATANTKAAAKRVAAKPAATPAKPTTAEREAARADKLDGARLAREIASGAVAAYYTGSSMPFKSATDRFSPLNGASRQCKPSARQAALLLAIITHGAGNFKPNGSFVRGGFVIPAKLINPKADAGATVQAQPESGCIGDMRDLAISYEAGSQSRDSVMQLHVATALQYIQQHFGDGKRNAALKLLCDYGVRDAIKLRDAKPKAAKAA